MGGGSQARIRCEVTTFYRIHRDEALRDREVARLLRKAENK